MVIVKVKKLNENAVLPQRFHDSDFCFDLVATSVEEIFPGVIRYGTGLAFEIDGDKDKDILKCLTIRPRSSIYKTGLVLSNSLGTIDYSYRGEVMAVFYHVIPSFLPYKVGDRIGQIHLDKTCDIVFEEADELSETERGAGGYGSTGI